jgi:hypothetical protein
VVLLGLVLVELEVVAMGQALEPQLLEPLILAVEEEVVDILLEPQVALE